MSILKKAIDKALYWVIVLLFTGLVLTTLWQVFSRLVLNSPVTWSEEAAKILFVWVSFLGAAFLMGERGHIAVDFLARKLPTVGQKTAGLWIQVLIALFSGLVLLWGGINAAIAAWPQNLTALPLSIGNVYLVIPISGALIIFYCLYHLLGILHGSDEAFPDIVDDDITDMSDIADIDESDISVSQKGGVK